MDHTLRGLQTLWRPCELCTWLTRGLEGSISHKAWPIWHRCRQLECLNIVGSLLTSNYNTKMAMWSEEKCFMLISQREIPMYIIKALTPPPTSSFSSSFSASWSRKSYQKSLLQCCLLYCLLPIIFVTLQDICEWPCYVWGEWSCKSTMKANLVHTNFENTAMWE